MKLFYYCLAFGLPSVYSEIELKFTPAMPFPTTHHIKHEMRLVEVWVDAEVLHGGGDDALTPTLKLNGRPSDGLQLIGGHVPYAPTQDLEVNGTDRKMDWLID